MKVVLGLLLEGSYIEYALIIKIYIKCDIVVYRLVVVEIQWGERLGVFFNVQQ